MPRYAIIQNKRIIRVRHGDLDKAWWNRGMSPWEVDTNAVENVIRCATGLKRIFRTHGRMHVDFILRSDLFDAAACAVLLEWPDGRDDHLVQTKGK